MAKLLIYYSLNHDKFKLKLTRSYNVHPIGYTNQFDEVLLKVINTYDLDKKSKRKFLYKIWNRKGR